MASGRMPVLVGVGQLVNHSKDPALGGDPVEYMVACAKRAGHDAHIPHILPKIDSLGIIQVMSRDYTHELKGVAGGLGAHPRDFVYTTTGATIPQILTARLCRRIARGQSEAGLICGAEAFYSGQKPDWEKLTTPRYDQIPYPLVGDVRDHATDLERRYGLHVPSNVYPLFANAFRKARGLSLEAYIRNTALLCETFSQVARDQEYAWFRDGKKAPEIATVTQSNRMINYPFTKYMNAIMNVDQAAALLIVSEDKADSLHIPEERRVYLLGSSEVYEKWYVSDRINYHASPGLELAFEKVFEEARTGREGIHYWELYSCFPVAVQIAMETLSLPEKTVPTVIGGLPYFGGPGNHYALHAICEMVRLLRERPERRVQKNTPTMWKKAFPKGGSLNKGRVFIHWRPTVSPMTRKAGPGPAWLWPIQGKETGFMPSTAGICPL